MWGLRLLALTVIFNLDSRSLHAEETPVCNINDAVRELETAEQSIPAVSTKLPFPILGHASEAERELQSLYQTKSSQKYGSTIASQAEKMHYADSARNPNARTWTSMYSDGRGGELDRWVPLKASSQDIYVANVRKADSDFVKAGLSGNQRVKIVGVDAKDSGWHRIELELLDGPDGSLAKGAGNGKKVWVHVSRNELVAWGKWEDPADKLKRLAAEELRKKETEAAKENTRRIAQERAESERFSLEPEPKEPIELYKENVAERITRLGVLEDQPLAPQKLYYRGNGIFYNESKYVDMKYNEKTGILMQIGQPAPGKELQIMFFRFLPTR